MKKSNRVLLFVGIVLVVLMIILGGILGYTIKGFITANREKSSCGFVFERGMRVYRYAFSGFKRLDVKGKWKIDVKYGDEWLVKVGCDELLSDKLRVKEEKDTLSLEFVPGKKFDNRKATAIIVLPRFVGLRGDGGLDLCFEGFHSMNELCICFSGGLNLRGNDSSCRKLSLNVDGGGSVNLKNVPVYDADVKIDGAGSIVLSMAGGKLNAEINGAGVLTYYGDVKDRNVSINGIGKVYHK